MELLSRVVVPSRLALIHRDGQTLGYNPVLNLWHRLSEEQAEVLRWLRAGRDRNLLTAYLRRRFHIAEPAAAASARHIVEWCVLRRLLYLDREPEPPKVSLPANPLAAVYWICTQACNLRCTYCYQEAMVARPDELNTEEALDLVDQVAEAGARTMVFTGGEPFSRRDLLTVARHARSVGLNANVITNGHYITERSIASVAETFDVVTVSLDHARPEHHDKQRGEGSWKRATQAIRLLLEAEVKVDVNSVLARFGLADVGELLAFVNEQPIGQHRIVAQFPMGRGSAARDDELSPQEIIELPDRLHAVHTSTTDGPRLRPEGSYSDKGRLRAHCGAGLSEVSVDPEGWVYPCKLLQYPEFRTQNVRDARLADIYANNPALQHTQKNVAKRLQPCATCIIRDGCGGGCRGIQYSFTGSYDTSHPLFCAYLRRQFEVRAWSSSGDGSVPPSSTNTFAGPERSSSTFFPLSGLRLREKQP
ncbi:radical SAM additional 4Fe4S-binding SPASM domain-containing protein [Nonomuraea solani]|uniref:Radical SAM additional 4Fe4S-binding SPASM domain-containing protein n=1 Tax=Nonomuraea solani TaxID=1144553 RepID=A0A1H6EE00_9ACTN|nr:radical SAM protein [Nonomuraea solani]SEG96047.1 radical SAM additional 4Fe4S-binding SPASM domain-containing protein [Nonomuraea solani]